MQAWEELDAAAEGMTVSEASGQIQKSPQQFLVARALFFELGSAKHVQSALSKAKGMVQHGKHFEVAGRRGDEAIWCLVNVFDVDRLVD